MKRNHQVIHGLVFLLFCCLSGGAGIATYFGRKSVELSKFQTEFNGNFEQLQSILQYALSQKFATSRLLNKMYSVAVKHGYGTTLDQKPPFFTLPGYQNYSSELIQLGGNLRGTEWHPLVVENNTRSAWESWAKKNIASQAAGMSPSVFNTINATGELCDHLIQSRPPYNQHT